MLTNSSMNTVFVKNNILTKFIKAFSRGNVCKGFKI